MTEEDTDDTTEESTRSDAPSDERESADQDGGGGFLSSITGYFSGNDDDKPTEQTADAGPPVEDSQSEPTPAGRQIPEEESATDIPQAESTDEDGGPATDEFAESGIDDEFAEPGAERGEPASGDDEQPFTDLIGEDEDEETGDADQTVDDVGATDTATGEAVGEPLQEGLDEVPDARETPPDIESDAEEDEGDALLESDEESEDPFAEMEGAFDEMDVEGVEPDEVWTDVSEAEQQAAAQEGSERMYAEVSKHEFCEQCEFFSAPPEAHCSHDGTEIVEFTDMEGVRVVDCPIVAERRGLEEGMHAAFDDTDEEAEALEMDEVGELEE
jgi:hypothetical protein